MAQKKGKKSSTTKTPDFVEKLFRKADEARKTGLELGKIAAEQTQIHGKKLTKESKKKFDQSVAAAKKMGSSGQENVKLLEELGKLKKDGLLTDKEFQQKKKELLDRI
jgi:phosphopantothenoylcysteine synthetase/decarboxylase